MGNEFPIPPNSLPSTPRYKQLLSIIPADESQLYGDNVDGQFFRRSQDSADVGVQHTFYKDDLRIVKKLWSFELDIPALNGFSVVTKFNGRLRRGRFHTVLRGQGMWKWQQGGKRGDLYVELIVK